MADNNEQELPEIKKVHDFIYEVASTGSMKVPLRIFASEPLMEHIKLDKTIPQGMNVATLPGIYKASMIMSDAHQGYGCPVGGVSAYDTKEGIISPGVIGFDINCGVRLLTTNLSKEDLPPEKVQELLKELYNKVPCGVGKSGMHLSVEELDAVLTKGVEWGVEKGYATQEDLAHCEASGRLQDADPKKVSDKAKARGKNQVGTLGSGNHFLEIQYVDEIMQFEIADAFDLHKDQIVLLIHCGSRGLGHQVCSDYLRMMEEQFPAIADALPDRDLIYAPADSQLAKDYWGAMCASANYAWMNRQMITFNVRQAFKNVFGDEVALKLVYDVAHNIAKREKHQVNGEVKEVYVHRKGATRAFPPGNPELPADYQKVGQPVFIPGSMGTSSYVLAGTETAMNVSFGSAPHGAGRIMSRTQAKKTWRGEQVKRELAGKNIFVEAASWRGIVEEAPGAYKDVDEVVKVADAVGIGKIVAQLKPLGVVKG